MWSQILFLFIVASSSTAININKIIGDNPNLQKCKPTLDMVDASGKMPSGIFSGNFYDLGAFDQCLKIEHPNNETGETKLGKYCVVKIDLPLELLAGAAKNEFFIDVSPEEIEERVLIAMSGNRPGIVLGWCVPHNCPIGDLNEAITEFFRKVVPDFNIMLPLDSLCQTKEDLETNFSANDIAIIAFLATTGFIMLISTLYDMYCHYNKKKPAHIILTAFSVLTNGQKLLSISKSPDQLGCLNGIRTISMMWVILGHKYGMIAQMPIINTMAINDWMNDPKNMYLLNATLSVDTFFVLGGLLVGYVFCLQMEKGIKFNIVLFYIHRYLRLTPVLAVVVWLQATIVIKIGSGPFWPFTEFFKKQCVDNWWVDLLYIQNYYKPNDMCLGQTWYLSVDMHLYILSPLLLLPLWKQPKYTMYSMVVLLLASMAIPFTITYLNEIPAFNLGGGQNFQADYYVPTHTRFGTWLMGLMLGYYLFTLRKSRHNRITLHPVEITYGWIVALGLLGGTLYGPYNLTKGGTILENSFMNGFYRHGWSLGVCWVIYACTQGYGGPINAFLSWSAFHVLGRFTYTMYLNHLIVSVVWSFSLRTVSYFTDLNSMYTYWGDFVTILLFAIILTLAYESPMITLEKVLFGKGKDNKKKTNQPNIGHTNRGFEQA